MALSKRIRFEVLRRDDFTCRYCGRSAPDVTLRVDHVTPVALGGTNEPTNLTTACQDCNAGKSSISMDGPVVADVRADAERYAALTAAAYDVLVERLGSKGDYLDEFENAYTYGMPDSWENSVGRWFEMGVPIDLLVDAAETACRIERPFAGTGRFTYMCGIVWKQVRAVDEMVQLKHDVDGTFMSDSARVDLFWDHYCKGQDDGERRVLQELREKHGLHFERGDGGD